MKSYDRLFIGGEWVASAGTGTIDVINPTTEEIVGRVPDATTADIDRAVAAARTAFDRGPWPRLAPAERAAILTKVSAALQAEMQPMAELITTEMGSPVSWGAMAQVFAPTMIFDYYVGLAASFAFDEVRQGLMGEVLVAKEPVGVVGAISPWNVPLFIAAAKLGPALVAGCTVVFKPAPETPLDALRLAEMFEEAGLPRGVLSVLPAGREVGEHLVSHPGVDKVSFTGSTVAGKKIGAICGGQLKRFSLELGGKSAAILLDDVNLAEALPMLLPNAIMNNGEACIAQTRILAPRDRYQEVVDALVEKVSAMKVGDPLDPSVEVGPLVAERQRTRVEGYLESGKAAGARVVVGGGRPQDLHKGWFIEPTVFADVDNEMKIAREEIFGPVLSVIPFDGEDQAVQIANDSDYGLCGSVWTANPDHGEQVAARVRTGVVAINGSMILDFNSPFGGFKKSGIGRELGPEGITPYTELQTIILPL